MDINDRISQKGRGLTRPIPSSVPEKVRTTWMILVNHVINLSSPSRNLLKDCACVRNTSKTDSGELEFPNAAAIGCVPRSCLVRVLNSLVAASNIAVKLAEERSVV